MIGLDTNVLVRYIAQDDKTQSPKANALIESLTVEEPGYVTQVALVEVIWVLSSLYAADRDQIAQVVEGLLRTKELSVEAAGTVWKALRAFTSSKADFADCLIERVCHDAHCEYTATFDGKAARSAGLRLIK
ncbi:MULTISPECIES: PIN domain-containing protein [Paraburkholderia]|uniref:Predicted nucleic-acid-binding protein, contains PIN domain n=1 Tax=Paraburkholderia megapolitana TaxID=420953 RepID=A0A1I3D4U6_9BURK|nr:MULTISPECIES: type II toxin-antitoxin system VapC family toxin [Paraburkholderia]MCX4165997.1 type II toxin-antitoxin system VapC family toxin [Paraburkholderia megapolitana]MDN7161487.1 type II toxin-antitoxin system VapC family toxin [Paraburkholderia sp. CHISQ3]MDQ6498535.1 type II toxin-antitoxin system VapC family toxin [Paraburkholderia megapolitana]QDQ81680.1 type II toxin-antitoxin system VapC family toxin [Paraburkholderia megapolitana]SFH81773.1 Predicted nucleic-acid-binding prot